MSQLFDNTLAEDGGKAVGRYSMKEGEGEMDFD